MISTADELAAVRSHFCAAGTRKEGDALSELLRTADLAHSARAAIVERAAGWVRDIRAQNTSGVMEAMLEEYALSTKEGVALMCLAEALLRVPDADTMDSLIADKIAAADWGAHLGHSSSPLVNASTWALFLTGRALSPEDENLAGALRQMLKRLGEPVIRVAAMRAVGLTGAQFILGRDIDAALKRAAAESPQYRHSYDMLGEAAATMEDARHYFDSYQHAILAIARANSGRAHQNDVDDSPGISVKLSALHPRYEESRHEARDAIIESLTALAKEAKAANIGLTVDAEESTRLETSLDIMERTAQDRALDGWDGFGAAVQAYERRAPLVIDWMDALARQTRRRMTVRLVKGAYWDGEIKRAQTEGVDEFPVFTRKAATDVSYIANARKLLRFDGRIYPQFATHNAHTAAAILQMAGDERRFEFQRLHGMGAALHARLMRDTELPCRIYAPVGEHRDLLAYLARRLLENGANASFINQVMHPATSPETVAACPLHKVETFVNAAANSHITAPPDLFMPQRKNARGFDLQSRETINAINLARAPYKTSHFIAAPILANATADSQTAARQVVNPADDSDIVGEVHSASIDDCNTALRAAKTWTESVDARRTVLWRAADLLEQNFGLFFALLAREAGKTLPDAVSELREAVDFLRYYAAVAVESESPPTPAGVFVCISPWNFPLAIFSGQIAAALATGNAVLAKPAEQTALIGHEMIKLLHHAGVPRTALQFLPGAGKTIGTALVSSPLINGVAFTGSTNTAKIINRAMAKHLTPGAPLIAETGGINAMLIDSTALPEQAVRDVVRSAFQSAGQRCSALRIVYVQEDILPAFQKMLYGAMDILTSGVPWNIETDIGPLIDETAAAHIRAHIATAAADGRVLKTTAAAGGLLMPLTVIKVNGIEEIGEEVFGPVLHLASFRANEVDAVINAVNNSGYGLTFGLHSRIDARVATIAAKLKAGNVYVNRDQIGAVVGSQPFGGEGLSGTGPKAGGARYLSRYQFITSADKINTAAQPLSSARRAAICKSLAAAQTPSGESANTMLHTESLPGPTGELNTLKLVPRGTVLCLGPGAQAAKAQAEIARQAGCATVEVAEGAPETLALDGFAAVLYWGADAKEIAIACAARDGAIVLLLTGADGGMLIRERHLCVDTTASGGNTALWTADDTT